MHGVVDGEFDHRQELTITRKGVDVSLKNLFENEVGAFRLTICFLMDRGGHHKPRSQGAGHGLPKLRREPNVTVGHEFTGYGMKTTICVDEDMCTS